MTNWFRVGFSADFRDDHGHLVFPDIGLTVLDGQPGVSYDFLPEYRAEYEPNQLAPYDVVISLRPRVTSASLRGIERLAAIGRCGVGYDNVDVTACTEAGVALYITPEGVRRPMAESIVLFVLALSHNLIRKDRLVRAGRWAESIRPLGREPRGRVLGIIGFGGIALELMGLLKPFQLSRVLAFDPYVPAARIREAGAEPAALDGLLKAADYVVVNCPLTPETHRLIGPREMALMKASSVLINTARGAIVDQQALVRALETGALSGAALDVFDTEPLASDSPLCRLENVILTSHSAGWTEELFRDMGRADCEGALAIFRGEVPKSVVNREVLDRPAFRSKLDRFRWRAEAAPGSPK